MLYQKPILEILELKTVDVICASVGGNHDGDNPGGDQSGVPDSWAPPSGN